MANVISNFARNITKTLIDDIQRKRTNWYYALGGIDESMTSASSRNLPAFDLSPADDNIVRSELVYFNKVQPGSVSRTVLRYDWIPPHRNSNLTYNQNTGRQYQSWCDRITSTDYTDPDLNRYPRPFYTGVMRDDEKIYDVYVCVGYGIDDNVLYTDYNATGQGQVEDTKVSSTGHRISIIKPKGRSVTTVTYHPNMVYDRRTGDYIKDYNSQLDLIVPPGANIPLDSYERGDGYSWKYLYSVTYDKMKKFADGNYVPISRSTNDVLTNGGAITDLLVAQNGKNYSDNSRCYIVIDTPIAEFLTHTTNSVTDPSVSTATISGGLTVDGGFKPNSILITKTGTGYLPNSTATNDVTPAYVEITNSAGNKSTGSGAKFKVLTNGVGGVTGIAVLESGIGYSTSDKVFIKTGGFQFSITVTMNDHLVDGSDNQFTGVGSIGRVTVLNSGAGILPNKIPQMHIEYIPVIGSSQAPTGIYYDNQGNGYGINGSAKIKANVSGGKIKSVTIVDPGKGYPYLRSTYIVVVGDGKDAAFTPVIKDGAIIDVIVDNPGTGYSQMYARAVTTASNFNPATDFAIFEAVINTGETSIESMAQTAVEQLAVDGALWSVDYNRRSKHDRFDISNSPAGGIDYAFVRGTGHAVNQPVVIDGDGYGATAVVNTIDSRGGVSSIKITNPGIGYTYATGRVGGVGEPGTCTFRFNIPPPGGHGANIYYELNSTGFSIYSTFLGTKALAEMDKTYSIIALMRSPLDSTRTILNEIESVPTITVKISAPVPFPESAYLKVPSNSSSIPTMYYRLVGMNGTMLTLLPLSITNTKLAPTGTIMLADQSNALSASIVSTSFQSKPVIDRNSGDLVYYNKIQPISFSFSTGVALKTFINMTSMYCSMSPLEGNYDGSWYSGRTKIDDVVPPAPPELNPH